MGTNASRDAPVAPPSGHNSGDDDVPVVHPVVDEVTHRHDFASAARQTDNSYTPSAEDTLPPPSQQQQRHASSFVPELRVHSAFPEIHINPDVPAVVRYQCVLELITCAERQDLRMPFELCLLLDVSGSMAGSKLSNLKEGVTRLLLMLQDHDIIHIVVYHSTPRVLVAHQTKADLPSILVKLQNLAAEGGTNISAALALTTQHLLMSRVRRSQQQDGDGDGVLDVQCAPQQQHVFLYTDGQPMEGITSLEELSAMCQDALQEHNLHVSTFGIGADVNGPLLEAMADAGGGDYAFVTVRRIEELSRKALMCLSRVVATRGEIEVILEAPGSLFAVPTASAERTYTFNIGDLREANVRRVGCAIDFPPLAQQYLVDAAHRTPGVPVKLAHLVLSCQPIDAPLHRYVHEMDVACTVVVVDATRRGGSIDAAPIQAYPPTPQRSEDADPIVRVTFALAEMSACNERALALLRGDGAETVRGAVQMLQEGLAMLRGVEPLDDRGFVPTAIRRVERTLQRLRIRGLRDAPRIALELHMHRHTFDHQSDGGFQASEADNHSYVGGNSPRDGGGSMGGDMFARFRSGGVRRGPGSSYGGSDDGVDSFDEGLLRSPPPPAAAGTSSSSDLGRQSPLAQLRDAQTLRPIVIPQSLRDAVAAAERGDPSAPYVPSEFMCTITQHLMDDPVMTCDGHTYQRAAITQWIEDGNISSPLTGLSLCDLELRPNIALRSMISNWRNPKAPTAAGADAASS